ncbi:MAG TPA: flagellin, partial [Candidatus Cloacimonadota bacterium]|nr:flagellin [Candidatus Cloacimonadota bacterium]
LNSDNLGMKIHFGDSNLKTEDYYFFRLDDLRMQGLFKDYRPGVPTSQKLSVSTQAAAQLALTAINTAMQVKDTNRIYTGMFQNRLNSTLNHLEDHIYRIEDIDSKISDVDFADEMTNFTSYQMLAEAATSMLAQANALPKIALKLLSS